MKPYTPDLRQKIVEAVDSGLPQQQVAEQFGVSVDTVARYLARRRERGHLLPDHSPGAPPRIAPAQYPALLAQLEAHPDATLAEHCAVWEASTGEWVSTATMCRAQARLGWTRKKRP